MRKSNLNVEELESLMLSHSSEIRKLSYQLQFHQDALDELKKQHDKVSKSKAKPAAEKAPAKPKAVVEKTKKTTKKKAVKGAAAVKETATKETSTKETSPTRRGRPKKQKTSENGTPTAETTPQLKKRGRPKKTEAVATKPAKATKGRKKAAPQMRSLKEEESKPKGYRLSDWDLFILNTLKASKKVLITSDFMKKAKTKIKKENLEIDEQTLNGKLNRSIHKLVNKRKDLVRTDYPGRGNAYGLPEWTDESGQIRPEYMELVKS